MKYWLLNQTCFVLVVRKLVNTDRVVDVSVMEPLASVAQLHLNMKPEHDNFTTPKILADVVFDKIVIALGKNQVWFL